MTNKKTAPQLPAMGEADDDVFELEEADPRENWTYFKFRIPGNDEVYSLPHMQFLEVGMVEAVNTQGIPAVVELMGDDAGAIRKLNGKQLNQLMAQWQRESKLTLGE